MILSTTHNWIADPINGIFHRCNLCGKAWDQVLDGGSGESNWWSKCSMDPDDIEFEPEYWPREHYVLEDEEDIINWNID